MLYRASTADLKQGRIARRYSYTVVVMQYYPRFLPKELVDEYQHALAPERGLFTEFKAKDRELKNHDAAFEAVNYEARFALTAEGMGHLSRLSELARSRDVYLICQCQSLERCHTDLLLLLARKHFAARTQHARVKYPVFESRLSNA